MSNGNHSTKPYDLIVLGAGPGGYPAAIRAAQFGLRVALIECSDVGGTCLNRGCIPSKALIACADLVKMLKHAKDLGVKVDNWEIDWPKMMKHKEKTVLKMRKGLEGLLKANGVELIRGYGKFSGPKEIRVTGETSRILTAEHIIIASGSEPREIPAFPTDGEVILDSTGLLEMKELPKSLVVIGGGVIGCEFASMLDHMGVKVTIVELLPRILPMESELISETLQKSFEKRGIEIHTGVKGESVKAAKKSATVHMEGDKKIKAEKVLVSVGRMLNTKDIGLEHAGLNLTERGLIPVDEFMQTPRTGIYSIGDLTSNWWLAHVATHQGIVAVNHIIGKSHPMRYNAIPSVIFTDPEIATVGMSLEQAKEGGYDAVEGSFPFQALGKSQASLHTDGFARVIVDRKTGELLGAQVVGYEAASMIAQMTQAITNELTADCILETIHAHPTISEAWHEAVGVAVGTPLHFPPKKTVSKEKVNA